MMRFAAKDHQRKALPFVQALIEAGHQFVSGADYYDLLLIDYDIDLPLYRDWTNRAKAIGASVLMYPHGAGPLWLWDGYEEPTELDACVYAEGYRKVMQAYGYPNPIHVVGWPYCPIAPLRPREVKRVLFAPIHPAGSGYLHPEVKEQNAEVEAQLLSEDYELTVRQFGPLEWHGLEPHDDVRYVIGQAGSLTGLEDADVVVANGTFAAEAIARGIPTVTFDYVPERWRFDNEFGERTRPKHWDDYWPLLEPPVSFGPGVVKDIAVSPEILEPWRREQFVGEDFNPAWFVMLAETVAKQPVEVI